MPLSEDALKQRWIGLVSLPSDDRQTDLGAGMCFSLPLVGHITLVPNIGITGCTLAYTPETDDQYGTPPETYVQI